MENSGNDKTAYAERLIAYADEIEKMQISPDQQESLKAYAKKIRDYADSLIKPKEEKIEPEIIPESDEVDEDSMKKAYAELRKEEEEIQEEIHKKLAGIADKKEETS